MASHSKRNAKKVWAARIILSALLIAALLISLFWAETINRKFGLTTVREEPYGGTERGDILESSGTAGDELTVHFVDVGQGDSVIIELPDDKKMIIDGGKDSEKQKLLDYIDQNIRDGAGKKLESFDYAILTHPDEDHCGGLDDVLETYPTEVFYRPNVLCSYDKDGYTDPAADAIRAQKRYSEQSTRAYSRTLTAGYNEDADKGVRTEVRITDAANEEISLITPEGLDESDPDYYSVTFYAPVLEYFSDVNDYSPVLILEYHGKRIALSGDAEKDAEADFVSRVKAAETDGKTDKYDDFESAGDTYSVNVLKLGHHGSKTSSSEAYLETLTSAASRKDVVCVISCALVNSYGHPSPETLNRLKQMGFSDDRILSTAANGSIALSVRAEPGQEGAAPVYNLYYGADMMRYEAPSLSVKYRWQEIVLTLIAAIVLLLIVTPLIAALRKRTRKAARDAGVSRRRK